MQEAIQNWVNGNRNYAAGIQLYLKYGKDARLRKCFEEKIESDFKKKLLLQTLTDMLLGNIKEADTTTTSRQAYFAGSKSWPENNQDEVLTTLREQWRPKYGELTNLQARIHDVAEAGATDPNKKLEAAQMAANIIRLDNEIRDLYATRDYYLKNGRLPAKPVQKEFIGPIEMVWARKQNLQRYLRDLAAKLKRESISDVKRNKWLPKWDDHVQELKELNNRLQRPENEGIPER